MPPVLIRALAAAAVAASLPAVAAAQPAGLGRQLYAQSCAECHGSQGGGVGGLGPSLVGVGELAADFYLRTGYMPLDDPGTQPERHPVLLRDREIRALETYIDSLGGGPPVPTPHPERGNVATGLQVFAEHCAGCHQIAAAGGIVTGARVPPLERATPTQIAEAVRIGPYVMPRFSEHDISEAELDSLIAYVDYAKRPDDAGGWAIDHLGPFPEGMVTWGIAGVVLVATCMLLGERLKRP